MKDIERKIRMYRPSFRGLVIDTHCHLEFFKRFNISSLDDCMKLDGENLGDNFLGCIVNFCQPIEWSRGAKLTEVSDQDSQVGITIGCHPHFASHMSDAPYFVPDRAKKNVMNCSFPGQVIHIAAKIADLKKLPVQAVLIANVNNASTIYHRYFI